MSLFRVRLVFHSEWDVNQTCPKPFKQDVTAAGENSNSIFIQSPQAAVEPYCWNRFNYKLELPTLGNGATKTGTQELMPGKLVFGHCTIAHITVRFDVTFFHG